MNSPKRPHASIAASLGTFALLLAAGCSNAPIEDADLPGEESVAEAQQALENEPPPLGEAEKHPSGADLFRVIAMLEGEFALEGDLDKSAIADQRERIRKAQDRIADALGAKTGKPDAKATARITHRYVTVPGMALQLTKEAREALKKLPDVARVEDDAVMEAAVNPSIGFNRVDSQRANLAVPTVRGTGKVVAVLDTGIDRGHPYLGTNRFVATACFSQQSFWGNDYETLCPNGEERQIGDGAGENCVGHDGECRHGTNVAGVLGGFIDDNGNGRLDAEDRMGVAPEVKFVSVQVFHVDNRKSICGSKEGATPCVRSSVGSLIAGLDHVELLAEDHDIVAVNMSLASGRYASDCDGDFWTFKWAVDDLRSKKIASIASSGNSPLVNGNFRNGLGFPACVSSTVSVGATADDDSVATNLSQVSSHLSLLAPGVDITTSTSGSGFIRAEGTSMAAPHVAGAWALMREHRDRTGQSNTVASILSRLRSTGTDIEDDRVDETFPRLDVLAALGIPVVSIFRNGFAVAPTREDDPEEFTLSRKNYDGPLTMAPTIVRADGSQVAPGDFTLTPEQTPFTGDLLRVHIDRALHVNGPHRLTMSVAGPGVTAFPVGLDLVVFTAEPQVTSFSPTSGPPTTLVTIEGANFSSLTRVQFAGAAPFAPIVVSPTRLHARVPAGSTTGPVRLGNLTVNQPAPGEFTVTNQTVITSVLPNLAPAGAPVTVTGGTFAAGTTVRFNQTPASSVTVLDPGTLTFVVPTGATAGPLRITSNGSTATAPFTVGFPVPTIATFVPATGSALQKLTIHGDGFYRDSSDVFVRFGTVIAPVTSVSRTRIEVTIPSGVPDECTITVRTPGGFAASAVPFRTAN
jgi:subtilisin family serine protease